MREVFIRAMVSASPNRYRGCISTYRNVVDPDQVRSMEGDGIASPDVSDTTSQPLEKYDLRKYGAGSLRVQVGDMNVLDDNVRHAIDESKTFSAEHTRSTLSDQCLVGSNMDSIGRSIVVGDGDRVTITAPVRSVNGKLACRIFCAPGSATILGGFTFGAEELECLCENNDLGSFALEQLDQLLVGLGVHGSRIATAGNAGSEALGLADSLS